MDFILGGCYQGKTDYVKKKYSLREDEILDAAEMVATLCSDEAERDGWDMLSGKRCLNHFHLLVKGLCEADRDVERDLEKLFQKHSFEVVVTDEIGSGIVPLDEKERRWRERTGRQCCRLAQEADRVERIYCGIATVLKG